MSIGRRGWLAGALLGALPARAETWPSRTVTLVSSYPPGASTDLVARGLAPLLAAGLGQSVVVENRPGGNGMLGSAQVVRARPDGHILQVGHNGSHGLIPLLAPQPPYDPLRDFSFVALLAAAPNALFLAPDLPAADVPGLLRWAAANREGLQVGTSGNGSHHHLGAAVLAKESGLPFTAVPFRGGAEALAALMGGHIPMAIGTLASGLALAREGRVKLLALVDAERAEAVPEVPRLSEYLPGATVPTIRFGLFGPPGLPQPVVERLNTLAGEALAVPEFRTRLADAGMQPQRGTPEETRARFAADVEDFRRIIAATGLQPG